MIKLVFIILFLYNYAYANPTDGGFFYRYDLTPPEDIFMHGFVANGENFNMYQHIMGASCSDGNATSGFVSTSSSEHVTDNMGTQFTPSGVIYYIYTIRPTVNFYNSLISLQSAYWRTRDERFLNAMEIYGHEQEWLAERGIHPSQIHSVSAYRSNGPHQQATYLFRQFNPGYQSAEAIWNSGYYTIPQIPFDDPRDSAICYFCHDIVYKNEFKRSVGKQDDLLVCEGKVYSLFLFE